MEIGARIARAAPPGTVIAFRGGLGAGKTTMTKGMARALGIVGEVTSPTYTIVSEYPAEKPLVHVDAYRLSSGDDFDAIGGRELSDPDGLCVIEWSERIADALPPDAVSVEIDVEDDGTRIVTVTNAAFEGALR